MKTRKRTSEKTALKSCLLSAIKVVKICPFFARKHPFQMSPAGWNARFTFALFSIKNKMKSNSIKTHSSFSWHEANPAIAGKVLSVYVGKLSGFVRDLSGRVHYFSRFIRLLSGFFRLLSGCVRLLSCSVHFLSGFAHLISRCVGKLSGCVRVLSGNIRILSGCVRLLSCSVRLLSGNIHQFSGFSVAGLNDPKPFGSSKYLHPPARLPPGCCAISL